MDAERWLRAEKEAVKNWPFLHSADIKNKLIFFYWKTFPFREGLFFATFINLKHLNMYELF